MKTLPFLPIIGAAFFGAILRPEQAIAAKIPQFTILYSFPGLPGSGATGVVRNSNGTFYGSTLGGGNSVGGTFFEIDSAGILTTVVSFDSYYPGALPKSPPVRTAAGKFFGTLYSGGDTRVNPFGFGSIVSVKPPGLTVRLHTFTAASFNGRPHDGGNPTSPLVRGSDGFFYGTTESGGNQGVGTLYKFIPAGQYAVLGSFTQAKGALPNGVILGGDGKFYGTAAEGGVNDFGTVFKVTPAGVVTRLISFDSSTTGAYPATQLLRIGTMFFGTTTAGGEHGFGTIFSITRSGTFATLHSFDGSDGANPRSPLLKGPDGILYGTTSSGGASDLGTFFQVTPEGVLTSLLSFAGENGEHPEGVLATDGAGHFFGTTVSGGRAGNGVFYEIAVAGGAATLVRTVQFANLAGSHPVDELAQGADGNFYGNCTTGGPAEKGVIFRMTPTGEVTPVMDFDATVGTPPSALVEGVPGDFYGVTFAFEPDKGTVFKLAISPSSAKLTTLHEFTGGADGASPAGPLIRGLDGNFYGTTLHTPLAGGTMFRLTPDGTLTTLCTFETTLRPSGRLLQTPDGVFYGTMNVNFGEPGGLFKVIVNGDVGTASVFANFDGTNGARPNSPLVRGSDGNLYGTTQAGGNQDRGAIFKAAPDGTITRLYSMKTGTGIDPAAGVIFGSDGNLYGTTGEGLHGGNVFRCTLTGLFTPLVNFKTFGARGSIPTAIIRGQDGHIYGTTEDGGLKGGGTIFRLRQP